MFLSAYCAAGRRTPHPPHPAQQKTIASVKLQIICGDTPAAVSSTNNSSNTHVQPRKRWVRAREQVHARAQTRRVHATGVVHRGSPGRRCNSEEPSENCTFRQLPVKHTPGVFHRGQESVRRGQERMRRGQNDAPRAEKDAPRAEKGAPTSEKEGRGGAMMWCEIFVPQV
eukprot:gene20579-biopygen17590